MSDAAASIAAAAYTVATVAHTKSVEYHAAMQLLHGGRCNDTVNCIDSDCPVGAARLRERAYMVKVVHARAQVNRTAMRRKEVSMESIFTSHTSPPRASLSTSDKCGSSPKKCSCCQRYRSTNCFSGAQLKRQGKRQCHDCLDAVCAVCGNKNLADGLETQPRILRIQRPSPAADLLVKTHRTCALVLGCDISQCSLQLDYLPASVCQSLISQCDDCLHDGAPVQCARCQRVYHTGCVGVKLEDSVFPVIVNNCNHGDCAVTNDVQSDERGKTTIAVETSSVAYKSPHIGLSTPLPHESLASSHASLFSIPAATQPGSSPLKRCSLCRRDHPDSSYSHAQLGRQNADRRRRCKSCITVIQRLNPDARLIDISGRLLTTGASELPQLSDLSDLKNLLDEMCTAGLTMSVPDAVVVRVIRTAKPQNVELYDCAATCIMRMCYIAHRNPVMTSTLVSAGIFSLIIAMLKGCTIHRHSETSACVIESLAYIGTELQGDASEPALYCDEILAGGALPMLLKLFTPTTTVEVWEASGLLLLRLLRARPPGHAQVQTIMPHLCDTIMTIDNPADLRCVCLRVLAHVVFYCHSDDRSTWIDTILRVAPGFTQRLIGLLDDSSADVREVTVALLGKMNERSGDLTGLIENGLIGRLLSLFSDSASKTCHFHTMMLCLGIAHRAETARALMAESQLIRRLLELVRAPASPWQSSVISVLASVLKHKDQTMARQLVEYKALNSLIPALKEACDLGNMEIASIIMSALLWLLQTGEAEQHNNHDINPYNEPIDWLGAFELVEPLRRHQIAWLSQLAEDVFAYFIPNDCD